MVDEKDRLGDKLRQKEKAEEDRFFAERDKALLEKLRQQRSTAELDEVRELARERCPKDGDKLVSLEHHDVTVEQCPTCRGMWLDAGELEMIAKREHDSWLGRFFFRPKR
ncbi:MAG TPA: zf-TFIIB domain-containing protein [Candidatus Binatia bacterium]|nr:zf-TFIIB domain-containing protein [Candidatus Binatia bacterium]